MRSAFQDTATERAAIMETLGAPARKASILVLESDIVAGTRYTVHTVRPTAIWSCDVTRHKEEIIQEETTY